MKFISGNDNTSNNVYLPAKHRWLLVARKMQ